jgi:hypothetical protein
MGPVREGGQQHRRLLAGTVRIPPQFAGALVVDDDFRRTRAEDLPVFGELLLQRRNAANDRQPANLSALSSGNIG